MQTKIQNIFLIFILSFLSTSLVADSLSAKVDRQQIEMGDIITLIVQTDFQTFSAPDFANLKDQFEILGKQRSSQITMINGNFESHTRWDLRLTPKQLGELIIPPFSLANVTSEPVSIKVAKASLNQTKYGTSYLEASVNRHESYVQQQIIYTLKFYHLGSLLRGSTRPPIFKDIISKQLTKQLNYQKNINGNNYEVYEWSWAIFPQKSGVLTIEPQVFNGQLRYNVHNKRVSQYSESIQLTIKPIPDSFPKHETWLPATSIKLAEEWQYNKKIRVGDSITRTIQIQAENLQSSQLPEIALEQQLGFHHYPDQAKLEDKMSNTGITSQSTRKIAIVPINDKTLTLPSYKIHWWNTKTDSLEVTVLPEKTFAILPALNQQTTPPKVQEKPLESLQTTVKINNKLLIWQLVSLFFAMAWILTLILWLKQRKKLPKNAVIKKEKITFNDFEFCNTADPKNYYQQLTSWLQQQDNEKNIKEQIKLELAQLQAHLFNSQDLDDKCLEQICSKIKQIMAEKDNHKSKQKVDKLAQLYL